jgi:hypothetical protein
MAQRRVDDRRAGWGFGRRSRSALLSTPFCQLTPGANWLRGPAAKIQIATSGLRLTELPESALGLARGSDRRHRLKREQHQALLDDLGRVHLPALDPKLERRRGSHKLRRVCCTLRT